MKLQQHETASTPTQTLWEIAETDNTDHFEALLASGVDINLGNVHGTTALMRAATNGRIRMVHSLLSHGADPNKSRNDGFTPLHLAAFFGHAEVVRILVEAGARVDAATRFGTSAQMWAAARTCHAVVQVLTNNPSVHELEKHPILTTSVQQISQVEPAPVVVKDNEVDKTGTDKGEPGSASTAIQTLHEPSVHRPELRDLVLAELTRQVQPSNRNVMLYASVGVVLIAAVFAGTMFRHRQQPSEGTLPISTVATANDAKAQVFSETLGADTEKPSEAQPVEPVTIIGTDNHSNVENSVSSPKSERINTSSRISTPAVKQTRPKREGLAFANQDSVDLQARDLPAAPTPVAKPKAVAAVNPEPSKPAPQTTQLITPSNSSTLKGKVIQWP